MFWIILAALGVPLWLVIGALGASIWSRRQFQGAPGVYKCKVRRVSGAYPGLKDSWPRAPAYARWVHDVLIVHSGLALVRNDALPVTAVEDISAVDYAPGPKGLGEHPAIVKLRLDDGSEALLATPIGTTTASHGPFSKGAEHAIGLRAS